MTDRKERAERWNEILPQLPGEMFMYYKDRLIEYLVEERDEAFNTGWNAAIEEIAEKAPYIRLFRLRESILANRRSRQRRATSEQEL